MDPEVTVLVTYLRARYASARHDESGLGAVEWAIIVSLAVGIALIVGAILLRKARSTANNVDTN